MKRKSIKAAEADLTPMLDIVFILLIFFIVTATFIQEKAIDMTPPPPSNSTEISGEALIVRIDENDLIRVGGRLTDVEGIRARVERAIAENPDISVIVQAHPQARNQLVIHSVDQSRSAGVQNVGFAVDGDGLL
ncbi:biopolymer transporter ExbD [Ponticaulis sp.]|jgi:biopolymer transport protein ExbD|uniref:ExbD/TolR family protein n=1 Tax=Ponticaulis sp. TaxID=2020902 RepID=UPI000C4732CF|nr:biopolymer transporter ExbD [Ponticaulis sp.]MAF58742.1 biopolymer transporter ExbD [Ponticaulis sp.]MBN05500.1 biopolymer transporter ExbD [Ponticaulis sp.]|tara:strand:- start:201 stop:602 length:402 start_codon:yes stop_codon:yes gene_type:complete